MVKGHTDSICRQIYFILLPSQPWINGVLYLKKSTTTRIHKLPKQLLRTELFALPIEQATAEGINTP